MIDLQALDGIVGMRRFELPTSSTPCWRDTWLRYIPKTIITNTIARPSRLPVGTRYRATLHPGEINLDCKYSLCACKSKSAANLFYLYFRISIHEKKDSRTRRVKVHCRRNHRAVPYQLYLPCFQLPGFPGFYEVWRYGR